MVSPLQSYAKAFDEQTQITDFDIFGDNESRARPQDRKVGEFTYASSRPKGRRLSASSNS